ncbi:hypothetical protein F8M41_005240 [Gigaspora margarita]|uniref:Uncharacterized protein n=1 Tax=Gigaspora margarita TaxID=4874 RepID=A0A8H4A538_GIGMA|nr:hypothetical protein F8M41_005240 [Gigaspora margarita]
MALKCTRSGEIKANSQVDSSDPQEESFTSQIKEFTIQELIVLKNWELANYIADKAYSQLIPKLEERCKFMNYLKEFYELQVTNYEKIEKEVLPKNYSDDKKLFKNAQILNLEVEIDRQEQEREEQEAKKQKIVEK